VKELPPESANINAFAERFIQTVRNECLDRFVFFGDRHLGHVVRAYGGLLEHCSPAPGDRQQNYRGGSDLGT
jgi:putative transposase